MRRYKYVGPADEGVELVRDGIAYRGKDGVFELPFELEDRPDFEEIQTKEKGK